MEYISSDANIWIDFEVAGYLDAPFAINDQYTYLMSRDAIEDELLSPPQIKERLVKLGLKPTEIDEEEFRLIMEYSKYEKLSFYDRVALSIAYNRKIILLTGDMALRKSAKQERVEVHGTL